MSTMRRLLYVVVAIGLTAGSALAQQGDEPQVDARLEGYAESVTMSAGSTSLTWLLLIFLAAVCLIGFFKDARRTHLD